MRRVRAVSLGSLAESREGAGAGAALVVAAAAAAGPVVLVLVLGGGKKPGGTAGVTVVGGVLLALADSVPKPKGGAQGDWEGNEGMRTEKRNAADMFKTNKGGRSRADVGVLSRCSKD